MSMAWYRLRCVLCSLMSYDFPTKKNSKNSNDDDVCLTLDPTRLTFNNFFQQSSHTVYGLYMDCLTYRLASSLSLLYPSTHSFFGRHHWHDLVSFSKMFSSFFPNWRAETRPQGVKSIWTQYFDSDFENVEQHPWLNRCVFTSCTWSIPSYIGIRPLSLQKCYCMEDPVLTSLPLFSLIILSNLSLHRTSSFCIIWL